MAIQEYDVDTEGQVEQPMVAQSSSTMMTPQPEYDVDTEGQEEQSMVTQSSSTMMTPQPGMMMAPVRPHRECRTPARMVAICDMIVNIMYLMFIVVLITAVSYLLWILEDRARYIFQIEPEQKTPPSLKKIIGYIQIALIAVIIFLTIIAAFIGLQLWIAVGLLRSTYIGTPAAQAIQKAKCWMCCHICLVVLNLLSGGFVFIRPTSYAKSSSASMSSSDSEYSRSLSSSSTGTEQEVDGFTLSFGGINIVILLLRILFIYIVHSFIRQLRSVGFSMY